MRKKLLQKKPFFMFSHKLKWQRIQCSIYPYKYAFLSALIQADKPNHMMKSVYPCKSAIGLLTQLMSYVVQLDRLYTKTTPNQRQLFTIDKNQSLARPLVCRSRWLPSKINLREYCVHLYGHSSIFKGIICNGHPFKKFNEESEFSWWTWGTIDQLGSRNELGQADLHGCWQQGGHIQSHLTHSALTLDPWQCRPCVNYHLEGSIALDHRHRLLAWALMAMEGPQRCWNWGAGWQKQLTSQGSVTD